MEVPDGLAGLRPAVDDETIAGWGELMPMGEPIREVDRAPDERGLVFRQVGDARHVLRGDDQQMDGGLRVDVLEGQQPLLFRHDIGGQLALDDSAEEARRVVHEAALGSAADCGGWPDAAAPSAGALLAAVTQHRFLQ